MDKPAPFREIRIVACLLALANGRPPIGIGLTGILSELAAGPPDIAGEGCKAGESDVEAGHAKVPAIAVDSAILNK